MIKQANAVKSRTNDGKPATGEMRQLVDQAAKVQTFIDAHPVPTVTTTGRPRRVVRQTSAGLWSDELRAHRFNADPAVRSLLGVIAVLEGATGLALLLSPERVVSVLLGTSLETRDGLVLGRVAGAALLALGLACWRFRGDEEGRAGRGIVAAMSFYNFAAGGVLAHAGLRSHLSGAGLWPAVLLHGSLGIWCLACLQRAPQGEPAKHQS